MSKFNALTQMGIQNPEEIQRFAIYTVENTDILRIIYSRKKGSILPVSRKYKFERIKKPTMVDSGTRQTTIIYEGAPAFRNAVAELNEIMDARKDSDNTRVLIAEEIRSLEEDIASRLAYVKTLVDRL